MDFDLDDFSRGLPQFDESEQDRMLDLIGVRRAKLAAQNHADTVQSKICEKIQSNKGDTLETRIRQLEDTDEELYRYIRMVENVRYGIWCNKCDKMKTIGNRVEEKPEDPIADNRALIAQKIDSCLEEMDAAAEKLLSIVPLLRENKKVIDMKAGLVTPSMLESN